MTANGIVAANPMAAAVSSVFVSVFVIVASLADPNAIGVERPAGQFRVVSRQVKTDEEST
jgi:hypothetical protein